MLYKVQIKKSEKEDENMPTVKSEVMLKDLLKILPELKKYKLEGDISTKIRKLRNGRRQRHYTLEVSRKFVSYGADGKLQHDFKVAAPITGSTNKIETLKKLKDDIITQIRTARQQQRTQLEDYTFSEGVKCKKLAEVYCDPGVFLLLQNKRIRRNMSNSKSPTTKDKYVGIEIEFAAKENRDTIADLLFEAGVGRHVQIKGDSSIHTDSNYPTNVELNVLAKETEYEAIITKICNVLNSKCHVRVDKSCGLHVHLDMRNRDAAKSFANLVLAQNLLYAMIPANRKNKDLCKYSIPVQDTILGNTPGHYSGVSSDAYSKYKTIEMRMHCGTTLAKKINSWVALLVAFANAPQMKGSFNSIASAKEYLGISSELVSYVEGRIAHFAKQHKKVKSPTWFAVVDEVESNETALDTEQSEVA